MGDTWAQEKEQIVILNVKEFPSSALLMKYDWENKNQKQTINKYFHLKK